MRTVRTLYTAMMVLLAKATDRELARMVSYLKEENRILRARLPERINVTPKERQRLLRFGRHLGRAIYHAVTIVSPRILLRWWGRAEGQTLQAWAAANGGRPSRTDPAPGTGE